MVNPSLQIKIAENKDCEIVIHHLKLVASWLKENQINQWQFLLEGGEDEEIKRSIIRDETYLVTTGEELVATFTLSTKQNEWDEHLWGEEHSSGFLYLHRLAVLPMYMGLEIGKNILSWVVKNPNWQQKTIRLDCVAHNIKLNDFYKNQQFIKAGVMDGHMRFERKNF